MKGNLWYTRYYCTAVNILLCFAHLTVHRMWLLGNSSTQTEGVLICYDKDHILQNADEIFSVVYPVVMCILWTENLGPDSILRWHLTSIGNPIVEKRRFYDHPISTMGFPILLRWHFILNRDPALCPVSVLCCLQYYIHIVQCCYNVSFLQNRHKRHTIAFPLGWDVGNLLWIQILFYILFQSLQLCMQCHAFTGVLYTSILL